MTDQLKKNLAIPYLGIHDAAGKGNIEAVKQYLAAGTDVNEKSVLTKETLCIGQFEQAKRKSSNY